MIITYDITFFSFWLCSAGMSPIIGNKAMAVKDADGLPYVPGRTLKVVLRDSFQKMIKWKFSEQCYGRDFSEQNLKREVLRNSFYDLFGNSQLKAGTAHFSDATLPEEERSYIIATETQRYLFSETSHLRILEDIEKGPSVAEFKTEVVIPCTLNGSIYISKDSDNMSDIIDVFKDSFGFVKRIGLHHSIGYGRCQMKMKEQIHNSER